MIGKILLVVVAVIISFVVICIVAENNAVVGPVCDPEECKNCQFRKECEWLENMDEDDIKMATEAYETEMARSKQDKQNG